MSTPSQKSRRKIMLWAIAAFGLLALYIGSIAAIRRHPPTPNDIVLATVNGAPVLDSHVSDGLPAETFDMQDKQARQMKLEREINALAIQQFFAAQKIVVPESDVDKEVDNLRKNPPSLGCPCCTYNTLDDYMMANYYSMAELRDEIRNTDAMDRYLDQLWNQQHQDAAANQKLVQAQRSRLEKDYRHAHHIFFNTFQQPNFKDDPLQVSADVGKKAQAAWERLQRGEVFEKVACEISEDKNTRKKGGDLGVISKYTFGDTLADLPPLKPGEYTKPVESPYGFHIFKTEPLNDQDILHILKEEFKTQKRDEISQQIRTKAAIKMSQS